MGENIELMDSIRISEESKAVCITQPVTVDGENQLHLDVNALREVLMQKDIVDLPVAIYSVVGPSRTGKSFLLNLMIRHEKHFQSGKSVVANTENEELKNVFSWRGGVDANTQGIYILDKPFLFTKKNNEKVVLFFMDTQGIFDNEAPEQEQRMLGALSFLMSSKQIFNIKNGINSIHTDHIVKYANLAEEIRTKKKNCSSFQQQSLVFVVRDWEMEGDYPLGYDGGEAYLDKQINRKKQTPQHELKNAFLTKTFKEILCFLLPPPEAFVKKMGQKDQCCLINKIGNDFLEEAGKLFHKLLDQDNISLKEINGKTVSCRQLYNYIEAYASIMNKTFWEGNLKHFLEVDALMEMNHIIQDYSKNFMQNLWNDLYTERTNREKHRSIFDSLHKEMMEVFDNAPKPESGQLVEKFRNVLKGMLTRIYEAYQIGFEAEDLYDEAMRDFLEKVEKITPNHRLMHKKEIKQATEELVSKAIDLKNKINGNIAQQCLGYFLTEGKQMIDNADKMQTKKIMLRAAIGLGVVATGATVACPPLVIFGPVLLTVFGAVSGTVAGAAAVASVTTTAVGLKTTKKNHEVQLASRVFREPSTKSAGHDAIKGYSCEFRAEVVHKLRFGDVKFLI